MPQLGSVHIDLALVGNTLVLTMVHPDEKSAKAAYAEGSRAFGENGSGHLFIHWCGISSTDYEMKFDG